MMDKYIPSKVCMKRDRLPYMTREIHRLINRKNRAHKQRKKAQRNSASPSAHIKNLDKKVRDLKYNIQKKMRQAYWQYIESIITPTTDDTTDSSPFCAMKRFWQYFKSSRKDCTGVATLKVKVNSHQWPQGKGRPAEQTVRVCFHPRNWSTTGSPSRRITLPSCPGSTHPGEGCAQNARRTTATQSIWPRWNWSQNPEAPVFTSSAHPDSHLPEVLRSKTGTTSQYMSLKPHRRTPSEPTWARGSKQPSPDRTCAMLTPTSAPVSY